MVHGKVLGKISFRIRQMPSELDNNVIRTFIRASREGTAGHAQGYRSDALMAVKVPET